MNAQERMERVMRAYQEEHDLSDEEMQEVRARGQKIVEQALKAEQSEDIELSEKEQEELNNL